jgi:uncharacterized cupredoxin-like copper-binding protein
MLRQRAYVRNGSKAAIGRLVRIETLNIRRARPHSNEQEVPMSRLRYSAAALALALASPATASPYPIQRVDLSNFRFMPRQVELAANRPVTLILANRARGGHDFTAPEFFAASSIIAGAAPGGKIAVPGGATRSITLVPRAGAYRLHCSHFLH